MVRSMFTTRISCIKPSGKIQQKKARVYTTQHLPCTHNNMTYRYMYRQLLAVCKFNFMHETTIMTVREFYIITDTPWMAWTTNAWLRGEQKKNSLPNDTFQINAPYCVWNRKTQQNYHKIKLFGVWET